MFYPATSHMSRAYGAPTTGRRKLAVHNENDLGMGGGAGGGLPSKTPSRAGQAGKSSQLVPSTAARVGLGAKTEGRDRNVLVRQEGGKGKGKDGEIEPKRLFASSSTLPPSKSLSNLPQIPTARPTQPTKTPARPPPSSRKLPANNLRTPGPATFRVPIDVSSTPLPSATRRRRSRSSHGSAGGGTPVRPIGGDEFKTPAPSAKWEEGDSLGSIDELVAEGGIELDILGEVEEESDHEVEYMPPKVEELPYEPDWNQEVDILHVTRRLQGLPSVIFGHTEVVPNSTQDIDVVPAGITLEPDENFEDAVFRRAVGSHTATETKSTIDSLPTAKTPSTISTGRAGSSLKPLRPPSTTMSNKGSLIKAPARSIATVPRNPISSARKTMAPVTGKVRLPLPPGMGPTRGSVLAPRPINKNLPSAKVGVVVKKGLGGKQVEEDDELRKALEEVGGQDMEFNFAF